MRLRSAVFSLPPMLCLLAAVAAADDDAALQRRRTPVVAVFEKCRDAVVNVNTSKTVRVRSLDGPSLFDELFDAPRPRGRARRLTSIGSGVVVHESGYIVTNAHVVAQASDVQISFADGKNLTAAIVAVDTEHDLAVVKVDSEQPLAHIQLGRSDDIMVGETVVAIGNPLGFQHTVTAGIVSALDRDLPIGNKVAYTGLIQTDASINPGNSGGPLLNINGDLIGINTAIRGDAQNIGFAIPVDRLWSLLPMMLDVERRERVAFGLRVSGPRAEVIDVRPDSPAAEAGLLPGDRVVRFNDHPLRDGIDYYVHLLEQRPGTRVRLAAQRGDGTVEASVPLIAIPPPDGQVLATRRLGFKLEPIPDRLRRRLGLSSSVGLQVESVDRRSPADVAGVLAGDILLRIDRVAVPELEDVGLSLERIQPGERVTVEGLRWRSEEPFVWTVSMAARGA